MLKLRHAVQLEGSMIRWGRSGHGPALVAIHGTPFSSQMWRRLVPVLTAHRTVWHFDLVGYGQSEMRSGQDVSLGVQNRILAGLLRLWDGPPRCAGA